MTRQKNATKRPSNNVGGPPGAEGISEIAGKQAGQLISDELNLGAFGVTDEQLAATQPVDIPGEIAKAEVSRKVADRPPPLELMKRAKAKLAHTAIVAIGREEGPVKFSESKNPNDTLRISRALDWEARRLHAVRWVPATAAAQVLEQLRLEQMVIGRAAGGAFFNVAGDEAARAIEQAATAVKVSALDDAALLESCMACIDGWRW